MQINPSDPPEAMWVPSGLNATLVTQPLCSLWVRTDRAVRRSQSVTVPSSLAEAMRVPSGLYATALAVLVCPRMTPVSVSMPEAGTSQTLTVLSMQRESRRRPSGLKAMFLPPPLRVRGARSPMTSQSFTFPSSPTEASRRPSGWKATAQTAPVWPIRRTGGAAVNASQTLSVPS